MPSDDVKMRSFYILLWSSPSFPLAFFSFLVSFFLFFLFSDAVMYRCRNEVRCPDGRKLWWAAGESIFQPCQPSWQEQRLHTDHTLIKVVHFLLCHSFCFLWCTHWSLSALSTVAVALVKVCLGAVDNHLFNNDRSIRILFYASVLWDRSKPISSTFIYSLIHFQCKIRLLTLLRDLGRAICLIFTLLFFAAVV